MIYSFNPFPLESLPQATRFAIIEAQSMVQSPHAMVFGAAIAAASTALQGAIDVELPTGSIVPPSLMVFVIAKSGDRKTTTDNVFMAPIHAIQQRLEAERSVALDKYKSDLAIWKLEHKVLENQISKLLLEGDPCEQQKQALTAHSRVCPKPPRTPHFLHSDTTIEALLQNLYGVWPHAALMSSEGSSVVNGRAMQQLAPINELWDGTKLIRVDRKASESFSIRDGRLTVSVMLQRKPFEQFLRRNESAAWETGLLARALIAEPMSNQGTRQVYEADASAPAPVHLQHFLQRTSEALEKSIEVGMGTRTRKLLRFDPEAKVAWLNYAAWLEQQLGPVGQYAGIGAFVSKLPNNVARLAALMHCMESDGDEIGLAATLAAISLGEYYTAEYMRLFGVKDAQSEAQEFGYELEKWLWVQYEMTGQIQFKITNLYRYAPGKIRKRDQMNLAINVLEMAKKIFVFRNGKPAFIELSVAYIALRLQGGV